MSPEFDGVVDTSDYVSDEETIKAAMEKNRALVASYGEPFVISAWVKAKVVESVFSPKIWKNLLHQY